MNQTAEATTIQPRSLTALALIILATTPYLNNAPWIPVLAAAAFAWLARINQGSRPYAMFSSVYAALTVILMPPFDFPNNLFNRLEPFFIVLTLGFLLGLALDGIQDNTPWAWAAPLILLLFNPSVQGGIALLGIPVLAALEKQQRFIGKNPYQLETKHLIWLATIIVGLAGLGLVLPKPDTFKDPTGGVPISQAKPAEPKEQEKILLEPTSGLPVKVPNTNRVDQNQDAFFTATTALLYFVVVILGVFLTKTQLEKNKTNKQHSLWDFMPIIAFFILATALLALALNAPNGGSNPSISTSTPLSNNGGQSGQPPTDPTTQAPAPKTTQPTWIPFVLAAVALLFAYLLFRRLGKQFSLKPDTEPENAIDPNQTTKSATNRIRAAYQTFLEYAQTQGIPRHNAETPLEFVMRYTEKNWETRAASLTLTNLYEPVRYGNQAAEIHAMEAENALKEIIKP